MTRYFVYITILTFLGCATQPIKDVKLSESMEDEFSWMESATRKSELRQLLEQYNSETDAYFKSISSNPISNDYIEKTTKATPIIGAVQILKSGLMYKNQDPDGIESIKVLSGQRELSLRLSDFDDGAGSAGKISFFNSSFSGEKIVIGKTETGDEQSKLMIVSDKKEVLFKSNKPYRYSNVQFMSSENAIFFVRDLEKKEASNLQKSGFILKKVGNTWQEDLVFTGSERIDAAQPVGVYQDIVFPDKGKTAVALSANSVSSPLQVFIKRADQMGDKEISWSRIAAEDQNVRGYATSAEFLVLLIKHPDGTTQLRKVSFEGGRVLNTTDLRKPDKYSIMHIEAGKNHVYAIARDDIKQALISINLKDGTEHVQVFDPGEVITIVYSTKDADYAVVRKESFNSSGSFHKYLHELNKFEKINEVSNENENHNLEKVVLFAKSQDGADVPYLLVKHKNTQLSSQTPTLVYSYAAYGSATKIQFDPIGTAWFEAGGVRLYCFARGGGDRGVAWREGGRSKRKPNSIHDTISCADDFIRRGFSSSRKMALESTSAGGVIISYIIARRPGLFKAIVSSNGVLNLSRVHTNASGRANASEYGDFNVPDEAEIIKDMDGYLHLKPNVSYPSVLFLHGYNDARVPIWNSSKYIAKLKKLDNGNKSLLMKTDFDNGHGLDSSRSQRTSKWRDIYSFLFNELEVKVQ